ncbi:saccharopine dehydrogenase [Thalassotalea sp. ND16A]|uniref:saccharopine dehydrogenase n=1 Tax=Thalassotalea sp. ND16A TaxID=1535422 RepID=UPI00051A0EBB|nr:saccharopine dehydrogenase [Thalassotalea sp. ND16A]KGJ89384.1 Saccharopine dehydrogenase (NAD(+), L-lysine-forming) [Thalassotalea sp. ND16A]
MSKPHIWLRAETKQDEQRTALTPDGAKQLIAAGFQVSVEQSEQSIFNDSDYQAVNCNMVTPGSWVGAPRDAIILGLKELPEHDLPLIHQHIYFAHAYKEQLGWQDLLNRFKTGGGELYDLEFLVDDNNRRIAAFGYWAGFAGAALSVQAWINQQRGINPPLSDIRSYANKESLLSELSNGLKHSIDQPRILVIGAKGRSGSGAVDLAKALNLTVLEWDLAETQKGGPFIEINDMDILVNCVLVNQDLPPFVSKAMLAQAERILAVIVDVSCDPYGSYNPLPIYQQCTTFKQPCIDIAAGNKRLSLIAIDHLPSLLPKESSEDYGQQLLTHLLTLDDKNQGVWPKALALYQQKIDSI